MWKIAPDIRKRWMLLALLNIVLMLVLFGALLAGMTVFAARGDIGIVTEKAETVGDKLALYGFEELSAAMAGERELFGKEEKDPSYSIALYQMDENGANPIISTNDAFLSEAMPGFEREIGETTEVVIEGHRFITYTQRVWDKSNAYVSVFYPIDYIAQSRHYVGVYSLPFILLFIVICVVLGVTTAYWEIKPIMEINMKQKSFINDMSHEIRTPLAIIRGNLENIAAVPDASVRDVEELLSTCIGEVDHMTDMASGLLDIVRGENRSPKHDSVISDTVSEVVEMYSEVAAMSNRAMVALIDNCKMNADREKVKQLLTILLDNALKYTRDGDKIQVRLKSTSEGCILSVSDTGVGVAKGELQYIFDRFYRADNVKDIPGTGLGLAIAKSVVEGMDGTISAQCNIPEGLIITAVFQNIK